MKTKHSEEKADLKAAEARITDLQAEVGRLREALTPLVNMGDTSIASDIRKALRPHERESFDAAVSVARATLNAGERDAV